MNVKYPIFFFFAFFFFYSGVFSTQAQQQIPPYQKILDAIEKNKKEIKDNESKEYKYFVFNWLKPCLEFYRDFDNGKYSDRQFYRAGGIQPEFAQKVAKIVTDGNGKNIHKTNKAQTENLYKLKKLFVNLKRRDYYTVLGIFYFYAYEIKKGKLTINNLILNAGKPYTKFNKYKPDDACEAEGDLKRISKNFNVEERKNLSLLGVSEELINSLNCTGKKPNFSKPIKEDPKESTEVIAVIDTDNTDNEPTCTLITGITTISEEDCTQLHSRIEEIKKDYRDQNKALFENNSLNFLRVERYDAATQQQLDDLFSIFQGWYDFLGQTLNNKNNDWACDEARIKQLNDYSVELQKLYYASDKNVQKLISPLLEQLKLGLPIEHLKERREKYIKLGLDPCQNNDVEHLIGESIKKTMSRIKERLNVYEFGECNIKEYVDIENGGIDLDILVTGNSCNPTNPIANLHGLKPGDWTTINFQKTIGAIARLLNNISDSFNIDKDYMRIYIIGLSDNIPFRGIRNFNIIDNRFYKDTDLQENYYPIPYAKVSHLLNETFNLHVSRNLNEKQFGRVKIADYKSINIQHATTYNTNEELSLYRAWQAKTILKRKAEINNITIYTLHNQGNRSENYRGVVLKLHISKNALEIEGMVLKFIQRIVSGGYLSKKEEDILVQKEIIEKERKLLDSGVFSNLTKNTINTEINRDNIYGVIKTKINSFRGEGNIDIPSLKVRIEDICAELMEFSDLNEKRGKYTFKNYEVLFTKVNNSSGDGFEIKWVLHSK